MGKDNFRDKYRVEQPENNSANQRRFTSKDDVRAMSKQERKTRSRKMRLRLASISLSLGILAGAFGYHQIQNYNYQNTPITLSGSLELGNTPEELGISQDIVKKIQDLKLKLKYTNPDELSDDQIIALTNEVEDLQFDILKSKISDKLDVEKGDIVLHPSDPKDEIPAFVFDEVNNKSYSAPEFFHKTGLSDDIASLIDELGNIQGISNRKSVESHKDIYNDLIRAVNHMDQFAGAEVSIDEKGKIVVNYTKIKELGAVDKGREIGE